jgi:hypothetical protein
MFNHESETDTVQPALEMETVAIPPEIDTPAPEVPFPSAALRSELAAREYRESQEPGGSVAIEVGNTVQQLELPNTLAGALALLREIELLAPADRLGRQVKSAKHELLRAHIHALSQAPAAPRMDYTAFRKSVNMPNPAALAYFTGACKSKSKRG